jgi:WD40 repeat protein
MKKLVFLVLLLLFNFNFLYSGELIFGWNKVNEAGGIQDMKFMPDNNMFILTCNGNELQIRNSADGELIKKYPGISGLFEFTPDSTKLVLIQSTQSRKAKIELRNLEDLSLILLDSIDLGADSLDPQFGTKLDTYFRDLKIDPIRPYAYVIFNKTNHIAHPNVDTFRLWVYNYLTMERIYDLTPENDKDLTFGSNCLSVSSDGRYLSAISEGKSYLRVWDLNTMKLIREYSLYDPYCQDCWCKPKDMKFSDINNDIIYYSGSFPRSDVQINNGIFNYSIQLNKILDTTLNNINGGKFILFDNEERIIKIDGWSIDVFNIPGKKLESTSGVGLVKAFVHNIIYSFKYDQFIGNYKEYFASAQFDRSTSLKSVSEVKNDTIYPNPTNGKVTIELPSGFVITSYQITNTAGKVLDFEYKFDGINKYSFDFSKIPAGSYLINLVCGKELYTYKVIKEY